MKWKGVFLGVMVLIGVGILFLGAQQTDPQEESAQILHSVPNITHAHGLAVDVADSSTLYIATHHGLLVLKNDKDLFRIGDTKHDFMGFTVHPTDAKRLYSSGHPAEGGNLGFFSSEDGGLTWKKVSDGVGGPVDFHAMTMSTADANLFYGWHHNGLQRSTDGGQTWEIVNREHQFMYLTTHPSDPMVVYGITPHGGMVSMDEGVTWTSFSKDLEGGAVSAFAINPDNAKEMLAFAEKLGGLGKSTDGGKTWQKIAANIGGEMMLYFAYDKNTVGVVYALTRNNSIYKSTDHGTTWVKVK